MVTGHSFKRPRAVEKGQSHLARRALNPSPPPSLSHFPRRRVATKPWGHGLTLSQIRRLMVSQDRDEIYIIIGEYGEEYEHYIRGRQPKHAIPHINTQNLDPTERNTIVADSLGSPTFLRQVKKSGNLEEGAIDGWGNEEVKAVDAAISTAAGDSTAPDTQTNLRRSGRPTVKRSTAKPDPDLSDYFSADRCLIMHRFGPWRTSNKDHMTQLMTPMLALMLQLHSTPPPDSRNTGASAGTPPRLASGNRAGTSTPIPSDTSNEGSPAPGPRFPDPSHDPSRGRPLNRGPDTSPSDGRGRNVPVGHSTGTPPRVPSHPRSGVSPHTPGQGPRGQTPSGGSGGMAIRSASPHVGPTGQPRRPSPLGNDAGPSQPRNPPTTGGGNNGSGAGGRGSKPPTTGGPPSNHSPNRR